VTCVAITCTVSSVFVLCCLKEQKEKLCSSTFMYSESVVSMGMPRKVVANVVPGQRINDRVLRTWAGAGSDHC